MAEGKRALIWIVDDVESVRKSIAAVLETADMTVRDYDSARHFLAEFVPEQTGCLVIDQHMPDMTGLELLQLLSARGTVPPAIVITGHGDAGLAQQVSKAGARALLHKPVDGEELIQLIESITLNHR